MTYKIIPAPPHVYSGVKVTLKFSISQHSRDSQLMQKLVEYLEGGRYRTRGLYQGDVIITKFSDIVAKIIPFFDKYPLRGNKALDYADFCRVADIMKDKAHLTEDGLEKILKSIKEGMNQIRS